MMVRQIRKKGAIALTAALVDMLDRYAAALWGNRRERRKPVQDAHQMCGQFGSTVATRSPRCTPSRAGRRRTGPPGPPEPGS